MILPCYRMKKMLPDGEHSHGGWGFEYFPIRLHDHMIICEASQTILLTCVAFASPYVKPLAPITGTLTVWGLIQLQKHIPLVYDLIKFGTKFAL